VIVNMASSVEHREIFEQDIGANGAADSIVPDGVVSI
jgi:hypothetical protein